MRAFWEKIDRFGGAEGVAFFREQLHVAGEGGRVAGDVDDALRLHGGDGFDHVGAYALARRVDDDHVGLFAALGQQLRSCARIHAVKFRIVHAVLCGIKFCVFDRLRDNLDADGLFRVPRKAERDRTRAAVEVKHRLFSGQPGKRGGLFIQTLGLRVVDLIKRGRGESELQAAERVGDCSVSIERQKFRAEHGIAFFRVGGEDNGRDARLGGEERLDELLFLRQLLRICRDADEDLAAFRAEADINMPDVAGMRGLVIGADAVFAHPVQNSCADTVGAVRLDAAVCDRNDRVRFSGEEARGRLSVLLLHGELHLVPIAVGLLCAGDGQGSERLAADARQAAVDVRALKLQLLRIIHVPQRAAAAFGKIRAIRLYAVRRRLLHAHKLGKDRRASDVRNADSAQFAWQRTGHEHDLSVDTGDARPVHGCGFDCHLKRIAAFEFLHSCVECFT